MPKVKIIDRLDTKLLNLKSGDRFIVDINLEGRRFCEIRMGYKHGKIKALFGNGFFKRMPACELRKLLADAYWRDARCDAFYKALAKGRKARPKNWQKNYS
tara:strand:- start:14 stop:316 length:303 start_codon:yes stop_codon:yes gene_type:complete